MKFVITVFNAGCGPTMRTYRATVIFPLNRRIRYFGPKFKTFDTCAEHVRKAIPKSSQGAKRERTN